MNNRTQHNVRYLSLCAALCFSMVSTANAQPHVGSQRDIDISNNTGEIVRVEWEDHAGNRRFKDIAANSRESVQLYYGGKMSQLTVNGLSMDMPESADGTQYQVSSQFGGLYQLSWSYQISEQDEQIEQDTRHPLEKALQISGDRMWDGSLQVRVLQYQGVAERLGLESGDAVVGYSLIDRQAEFGGSLRPPVLLKTLTVRKSNGSKHKINVPWKLGENVVFSN